MDIANKLNDKFKSAFNLKDSSHLIKSDHTLSITIELEGVKSLIRSLWERLVGQMALEKTS